VICRHADLMPGADRELRTVPELFEAVAAAAGNEPAVIFEEQSISYAELNAAANRLARCLIASRVRPDSLVAVAVPRSADLVVVILAVLKAGGAYLALDPAYPAERLTQMITDARPVLVVRSAKVTMPNDDIPAIVVDDPEFRAQCEAQPGHNVSDGERHGKIHPEHLMYVVYTSGSTGRPKGVAVTHGGVANLVASQARQIGAGRGDRVLQWASISFDASFWDLSLALLSGAVLVMAPADQLLPGQPLRETMIRYGVTHAALPPVALSVTDPTALLPGGTVVSTGDAITKPLARSWAEGRRMLNGYGPTEVTVGIAMGPITGREEISIGRPLVGGVVHVLDEQLKETSDEHEGEFYLAGAGLARGYLNRPGETAVRFVADPAGPPGSRMYRSGDRGWRRADGELFFAGRADDQVKVRGFRIELGEIETHLARHPAVKLACAVVEGGVADARVVGYVTTVPSAAVTGAQLRHHVAASLPGYMVPSSVVLVDQFPTTPNGKVDRAALRAAAVPAPAREAGPTVGRDICGLVKEVLGVNEARPEDNFFDLGGHSVLATILARQIRKAFGVTVPMQAIFEAATLADLARIIWPDGAS
jgi:amino acid adenylation domain-containing protein